MSKFSVACLWEQARKAARSPPRALPPRSIFQLQAWRKSPSRAFVHKVTAGKEGWLWSAAVGLICFWLPLCLQPGCFYVPLSFPAPYLAAFHPVPQWVWLFVGISPSGAGNQVSSCLATTLKHSRSHLSPHYLQSTAPRSFFFLLLLHHILQDSAPTSFLWPNALDLFAQSVVMRSASAPSYMLRDLGQVLIFSNMKILDQLSIWTIHGQRETKEIIFHFVYRCLDFYIKPATNLYHLLISQIMSACFTS